MVCPTHIIILIAAFLSLGRHGAIVKCESNWPMNSQWFGDSFDIVKRFFIGNIREMGYQVFVDPMFTGEWNGLENKFYDFLGAAPLESLATSSGKTALLLDPDTGIGLKPTKQHVTVRMIVKYLQEHEIVFSFDQSFSHSSDAIKLEKMREKLSLLKKEGAAGFYYDFHACFLFSATSPEVLANLKHHLVTAGFPEKRFISQ